MEIRLVNMRNAIVWAVVITDSDIANANKCENCGKRPVINHPRLAKEIHDWCLECNDDHERPGWTNEQFKQYCLQQSAKGMATVILKES